MNSRVAILSVLLSLAPTVLSGERVPGADEYDYMVGGERVPDIPYPFVVRVYAAGGRCTGTLVAPDKVLTAAHCFEGSGSFLASPATVSFRTGHSSVTSTCIEPYEYYDSEAKDDFPNDAALIHLSSPVPIRHAAYANSARAGTLVSIGWRSGVLQQFFFRTVGLSRGGRWDLEGDRFITGGDSGGPLLALTTEGWTQVAISVGSLADSNGSVYLVLGSDLYAWIQNSEGCGTKSSEIPPSTSQPPSETTLRGIHGPIEDPEGSGSSVKINYVGTPGKEGGVEFTVTIDNRRYYGPIYKVRVYWGKGDKAGEFLVYNKSMRPNRKHTTRRNKTVPAGTTNRDLEFKIQVDSVIW